MKNHAKRAKKLAKKKKLRQEYEKRRNKNEEKSKSKKFKTGLKEIKKRKIDAMKVPQTAS